MKRIEILKEYRKMRFEELYGDGRIGRLSQEGAGSMQPEGKDNQRI